MRREYCDFTVWCYYDSRRLCVQTPLLTHNKQASLSLLVTHRKTSTGWVKKKKMFTVIIYRKRSGHHCYSVKAIGFQKLLFEKLPLFTRTLGPFQGALWDTEICMVLWLSILCLSKCLDLFIAGQKRCSDNHLPSATASPLGSLREDAGLLDSSFINMVMRSEPVTRQRVFISLGVGSAHVFWKKRGPVNHPAVQSTNKKFTFVSLNLLWYFETKSNNLSLYRCLWTQCN